MNVVINGISYKAVKTEECDEKYTEYNVLEADKIIGKVTKYDAEVYYTAWDNNGNSVATRKTVAKAVEALVKE